MPVLQYSLYEYALTSPLTFRDGSGLVATIITLPCSGEDWCWLCGELEMCRQYYLINTDQFTCSGIFVQKVTISAQCDPCLDDNPPRTGEPVSYFEWLMMSSVSDHISSCDCFAHPGCGVPSHGSISIEGEVRWICLGDLPTPFPFYPDATNTGVFPIDLPDCRSCITQWNTGPAPRLGPGVPDPDWWSKASGPSYSREAATTWDCCCGEPDCEPNCSFSKD